MQVSLQLTFKIIPGQLLINQSGIVYPVFTLTLLSFYDSLGEDNKICKSDRTKQAL